MPVIHLQRPTILLKESLGVKVRLQAAVDLAITPMILSANRKTMDDCPSYVFFALANPLTTGVIFVCDSVEPTVFLVETTVVKELFAEAGCEELSVLQTHLGCKLVWQIAGGLDWAVVGCKNVHGCFEQVN
jgi:hypothetical protein